MRGRQTQSTLLWLGPGVSVAVKEHRREETLLLKHWKNLLDTHTTSNRLATEPIFVVQGWLAADWTPSGPTGPEHPLPFSGSQLKNGNHRNKRLVLKPKNKITKRLCSDWRSQTHTRPPPLTSSLRLGLAQRRLAHLPPVTVTTYRVPHTLTLIRSPHPQYTTLFHLLPSSSASPPLPPS